LKDKRINPANPGLYRNWRHPVWWLPDTLRDILLDRLIGADSSSSALLGGCLGKS